MGTTWICMHAVPQASKKMLWSLWRSLFLGIVFYYFAGAQKNKWRVSCTWEAVVAKTSRASLCCFLSPRFFLNAFNGSAEAVKVSLARRGEIKKSVVKELCSSAVYKPVHAVILFFIHLSCILEGLKSCQNVSINVLFLLYINTAATFYWDKMKQINSIFFFSPRRIIIAFETEAFYLIKVSIFPDRLDLFVFQVFGCFFFFFVFEEFAQTLKNVGELLKFAPLTCQFQTHTHLLMSRCDLWALMSVSRSFLHKRSPTLFPQVRFVFNFNAGSCIFSPFFSLSFSDILRLAHMWEAKQTFLSSLICFFLYPTAKGGKKINQPCTVWVSFSSCDQRASVQPTIRGPRGRTLECDFCTMIQLPYEHEKINWLWVGERHLSPRWPWKLDKVKRTSFLIDIAARTDLPL